MLTTGKSRIGICPAVQLTIAIICPENSETCDSDSVCPDNQKCCSNGCGRVCKKRKFIYRTTF